MKDEPFGVFWMADQVVFWDPIRQAEELSLGRGIGQMLDERIN